jgi:hypothetical protein
MFRECFNVYFAEIKWFLYSAKYGNKCVARHPRGVGLVIFHFCWFDLFLGVAT